MKYEEKIPRGQTSEETEAWLNRKLMQSDRGTTLLDRNTRINHLLKIEKRTLSICKKKQFKVIGITCPFCGWTHT